MPIEVTAQYGMGIFALSVLAYVLVTRYKGNGEHSDGLTAVVQNNTQAIQELMAFLREQMGIQRQMLDEVLSRLRSEKP